MSGKTHIIGGIAIGAVLAQYVDAPSCCVLVSGAAALLPDIDTPESKLGRRIPGSFIINLVFGHRGAMHSLLMAFITYLIFMSLAPQYAIYVLAGYLSHLFLDMFTGQGVSLFWPIQKKYRMPFVPSIYI